MRSADLRVGHAYALPTGPGPWCRHAVPARVMTRAPAGRVLVLLPDGFPGTPTEDPHPCGSLVWLASDALACPWDEWPERAEAARGDMVAAVASVVAAIGGQGAPVLATAGGGGFDERPLARARAALNRWARPEPRSPWDGR